MERLRQLLACATGRRLAATLAAALLLLQVAAAGHLHLPLPEQDRGGSHAVCDLCVAADRAGIGPPCVPFTLPFLPAIAPAETGVATGPAEPVPQGYSARAPPASLS